jgi:glc operon protein GlcG
VYEKMAIGLQEARNIVDAIMTKAEELPEQPVIAVVVDDEGELVALARMDQTPYLARSIAIRKAYTAARTQMDSAAFGEMVRDVDADLSEFGNPMLLGFKGGVCIRNSDTVIGAIGVGGRSPEQDESLAQTGLDALSAQ